MCVCAEVGLTLVEAVWVYGLTGGDYETRTGLRLKLGHVFFSFVA